MKKKRHGPWVVWPYAGGFSACLIPIVAGYFTEICYAALQEYCRFYKTQNLIQRSQMPGTESCSKPMKFSANTPMFFPLDVSQYYFSI